MQERKGITARHDGELQRRPWRLRRAGERGERGERDPQGSPGQEGELDTYVVTGPAATGGEVGTDVTSTALCLGNDIAVVGNHDTTDLTAIEVEDSAPVFVGTGPATGWRVTASIVAPVWSGDRVRGLPRRGLTM
ncbi:hypothetical protein [Streptomyces wuyuanensis]|uniref:hypothetical protein n=1 Tax=Streptomyces wuyuanensis TaxID=1196353 RepID=UPI003723022A